MIYKLKSALKKSKMVVIIMIAIWIVLSILLSAPITVSLVETTTGTSDDFFGHLFNNINNIWGNFAKSFGPKYIGTFLKVEGYVTIGVLIFFVIGIIKSMPKNEYTDIEHGSSDWAAGEQYSILDKKKGIILAENHYLPVDKRGNVNVLVVGRIRFW